MTFHPPLVRASKFGLTYGTSVISKSVAAMAAAEFDVTPSEVADDSAAIDVAELVNQYGIAVRAGAFTPQMGDEIRLRKLAGLSAGVGGRQGTLG